MERKKIESPEIFDVRQRLLFEMRRILNVYGQMNSFCYELYTLMSIFSIQNKFDYNMNIHCDLLNIANTDAKLKICDIWKMMN